MKCSMLDVCVCVTKVINSPCFSVASVTHHYSSGKPNENIVEEERKKICKCKQHTKPKEKTQYLYIAHFCCLFTECTTRTRAHAYGIRTACGGVPYIIEKSPMNIKI